jgi:glycosyltransferase involved in cell wall biosynthesis
MSGAGHGPAVSVVLATRNRAALLGRSIDSVLGQTFGDLELIVVDDGSTDATSEVLASVRDARVRCIRLDAGRGLPVARNAGIAQATASFVAFNDDDDEWVAHKLERQMRAFADSPDAAVVYSDMHRVRSDGGVLYLRAPAVRRGVLVNAETGFWQPYMLGIQSAVIRRACLDEAGGFDERMCAFEDLDLFLRLALRNDFVRIAEPLVRYHATSGGLTTDRRAELAARRRLVRKYAAALLRMHPRFLVKETVDALLKRSLLPIVARHTEALAPVRSA